MKTVARCVAFAVATILSGSALADSESEVAAPAPASALPPVPNAASISVQIGPANPPHNYVGASIMGVAGFLRQNIGSFEVYYERVLARHHGLRIAFDFVHIHHNAEYVQSHQWTIGGNLSYRYYLGDGYGAFGGLKMAYRRGTGHYMAPPDTMHTHLANEQFLALAQGGYRFFIPRAHLSIATAMAMGYGYSNVVAINRQDETGLAIARLSRDNLATTPVAIDLELSLAYAF